MLLNAKVVIILLIQERARAIIFALHGTGIGIDVNSTETTSHEGCVQSGAVNNINFTLLHFVKVQM